MSDYDDNRGLDVFDYMTRAGPERGVGAPTVIVKSQTCLNDPEYKPEPVLDLVDMIDNGAVQGTLIPRDNERRRDPLRSEPDEI